MQMFDWIVLDMLYLDAILLIVIKTRSYVTQLFSLKLNNCLPDTL